MSHTSYLAAFLVISVLPLANGESNLLCEKTKRMENCAASGTVEKPNW